MDWDGQIHWEKPEPDVNPQDVQGTYSRYVDEEGEHFHWVYIEPFSDGLGFDEWDSWYFLIDTVIEDHSYST